MTFGYVGAYARFLKKNLYAPLNFNDNAKNERVGPTCQVGKDTPTCLKYSVGKGTAAMHVVD